MAAVGRDFVALLTSSTPQDRNIAEIVNITCSDEVSQYVWLFIAAQEGKRSFISSIFATTVVDVNVCICYGNYEIKPSPEKLVPRIKETVFPVLKKIGYVCIYIFEYYFLESAFKEIRSGANLHFLHVSISYNVLYHSFHLWLHGFLYIL